MFNIATFSGSQARGFWTLVLRSSGFSPSGTSLPSTNKIFRLIFVDVRPRFNYIQPRTSPISDAAWEAFPDRAGECGARGRACNPLPGGFGSSARPALRPVREKHRCTETGKLRGKPDGGLIPGSAELKPGSGVRSPKPEPRWNADRCAPGAPGAAVPVARQNEKLRLSAFRPRIFFFRSFPFVIARLDPAIHAAVKHAKRLPPSVCLLAVRMDHRIKSGGDESESAVTVACHSSDAQTHRENEILFSPLPAVRGEVGLPTGPARRGRPDDKLRNPGEGACPRV